MQLPILKSATVASVQEAFNNAFPYLKIAFFTRSHKEHGINSAKTMITNQNTHISDLPGFRQEGLLAIEPHLRTWAVEKLFEEETGLHVQVFRKSGNLWLETSRTDDLTLAEQNERARAQAEYHQAPPESIDYREMD